MKTCLVLEGGGLRGIYSAGVLDEMFKDKIKVDAIIGVSMGALIGINYKSKQPERAIRYNLRYCNDKRYIGLRSLLKTGNIETKSVPPKVVFSKFPQIPIIPINSYFFEELLICFLSIISLISTFLFSIL